MAPSYVREGQLRPAIRVDRSSRTWKGERLVSKRSWVFLAVGCVALVAVAAGWPAAEATTPSDEEVLAAHTWSPQDPAYEGGRTACRRCHIRQFRSWEATPHAKAFESLPAESQGDANCVKCHATGVGTASGFKSLDETPNLAGVTCEQCHGPGSLYKDRDTMQDRDASVAAGLLIPDEATCTACHNEESPTFEGFNYEEALKTGVHEVSG